MAPKNHVFTRIVEPQVSFFYSRALQLQAAAAAFFALWFTQLYNNQTIHIQWANYTSQNVSEYLPYLITIDYNLNNLTQNNMLTTNLILLELANNTEMNYQQQDKIIQQMLYNNGNNTFNTEQIIQNMVHLQNNITTQLTQILGNISENAKQINSRLDTIIANQNKTLDFLGDDYGDFVRKSLNDNVNEIGATRITTVEFLGDVCEYDPLGFGPISCERSSSTENQIKELTFREFPII